MNAHLVVVKGGGDLATGIVHRIWQAGFKVIITEIAQPMAIRRTVSFAEAIYSGEIEVEGVKANTVDDEEQALEALARGTVPVILDPQGKIINKLSPLAVVDAILAKKNLGTTLNDAPIVIGVGPGFTAKEDVHAVIETQRGHNLGRVILTGTAAPNTGIPGLINGFAEERVLYATDSGIFKGCHAIGDFVKQNETIAYVGQKEVKAKIDGVLRGILHNGVPIVKGTKIGDVDARAKKEHCFTISDKARAVGGGVLEALMYLTRKLKVIEKG
ncbi:selenium-dependent molybdenum cofactor biosynthesis protein YqeB [Desulfitobacterium sp. Sab5]|uniref:selenium-dependent molybdenum cofactor biosynthesis protein YqeB n=1 Tax=Desulfitobacterium nosdiversum TaxID=3375356 RepID=UPI003CF11965